VEQLRDVPPGFFAVRRKKTRLYHRRLTATTITGDRYACVQVVPGTFFDGIY
jgi:hypothetical protein